MPDIRVRTDSLGRSHVYRVDELPDGPAARNMDCGADLADALGLKPGHCYRVTVQEIEGYLQSV